MISVKYCVALCLLLCVASAKFSAQRLGGGLKRKPDAGKSFVVTTPQPHSYLTELPVAFDWSNVSGHNYLTSSRNQHIPNYCGSCWAISTTTCLADRIRIQRHRQWPDYMIAVQEIVNCVPSGCAGGDPDEVHAWIHKNGIAPDTCQNYIAFGGGNECRPDKKCENCVPGGPCSAVTSYPVFGVSQYGQVLGVEQMKAEIVARGPIACGIDSSPIDGPWGYGPNRTQIFDQGQQQWAIDHEISVVGFGEEDGVPYWRIRNSWGEYWGDNGFFRLRMGQNQLDIEGNPCSWAVPIPPA